MKNSYLRAKVATLKRMRPVILQRDNYQCVACGNSSKLETAHFLPLAERLRGRIRLFGRRFRKIKPQSWNELNDERNLVILCSRCHAIYDMRWWQVPELPRQQLKAESNKIEGKIDRYLRTLYPFKPLELVPYAESVYFSPSYFKLVGKDGY